MLTIMSSKTIKRRGRPSLADTSVTIRVDSEKLGVADSIAADLESIISGMKQTRMDVLRAALSRGIEVMRADMDAQLKASKRGNS